MLQVEELGKVALVRGQPFSVIMELSTALPGRTKWRGRELEIELSRANIDMAEHTLGQHEFEWLNPVRRNEVSKVREQEAAQRAEAPAHALGYAFKTEPKPWQRAALERSARLPAFGYFFEMGLGKTKVTIDNAALLHLSGDITGLLVTTPNGVQHQWVNEQFPAHCPDIVRARGLVYKPEQTKAWQKEFDELLDHPGLAVLVVNPESFSSKRALVKIVAFLKARRCMWAYDESIRIKTPGAQRTKAVLQLRTLAPYRRILTGAPITRGVEDLYSQFAFLDPDILGFKSFYTFRNRYCRLAPIPGAPQGAMRVVGYQNVPELQERVAAWTARERADAVLGLPERTYVTREVQLSPEQRRAYAQLRDDMLAVLANGELVATPLAITQLLRLQQVVGGFVASEAGGPVHQIPSNRVSAALEAAEEAQGKVVIWARFRAELEALREAFERAGWCPARWDDVGARPAEKQRFIEDDSCRAFIANPASAGTGLDGLQHASRTMIYFSNSFSSNDRWQSEARLYRTGQTGTVNVVDLVAPGTLDAKVLRVLRERRSLADMTIDHIKDMLSED